MCGDVAACQDSTVHLGMQGLHPSVQDLRKARDFADTDSADALALEEFLRAARSNDFPSKIYQTLHEGNQAGLIADAY